MKTDYIKRRMLCDASTDHNMANNLLGLAISMHTIMNISYPVRVADEICNFLISFVAESTID